MEIRRLTETDLPALGKLYQQFWGEESSLEKMRATFARLQLDPHYIFLVAERQEQVAGSVMGIVCEELYGECQPFLVIEDMIVDQAHRRTGVGTALLREMERCAAEQGCSYIILVTETERGDAQQFYASLGYKLDAYKGFKKRL
ncbi:MAG: GNAT family N-acetyltransferase [Armatimonadota bacterium]